MYITYVLLNTFAMGKANFFSYSIGPEGFLSTRKLPNKVKSKP